MRGMTQKPLARGPRRLRQGRRVPAPRPGAPARARAARSRDARLPRRRDPARRPRASTCELLERRASAPPSPTSRAPVAGRARRRPRALGQRARRPPSSTTGEQRGEIAGYLAKYATKSTEQAGGLLHRIDPEHVDHAPVREHVRRYMRTAFDLDVAGRRCSRHQAPEARRRAGARRRDRVEPRRARAARPHGDGPATNASASACTTATCTSAGRHGSAIGPERDGTTLTAAARHRRQRAPRRRRLDRPAPNDNGRGAIAAIRGWPRARTRSATAATA